MILKSVDPEPLQKELYLSEKDLVRQRHITPPPLPPPQKNRPFKYNYTCNCE